MQSSSFSKICTFHRRTLLSALNHCQKSGVHPFEIVCNQGMGAISQTPGKSVFSQESKLEKRKKTAPSVPLINLQSLPWVGLIVAISWGFYNLIRKKINIDTDIGLLIESLYILPFAVVAFYLISINGHNDFTLSNPPMMLFIFLAGPMTVIPLFLYVRGVELCGLGPTGMIFYITPTFQFLLGFFYYDEPFSVSKLVSFILIWIAVIIYLKDLYETS